VKKRREKNIEEVGRLIGNPAISNTGTGRFVCDMRVELFNEQYRSFVIAVTAFDAVGEECAAELSPGDEVEIDGKLRYRSWFAHGRLREGFSILARRVERVEAQAEPASDPVPSPPGEATEAAERDRSLDHDKAEDEKDQPAEQQLAVVGGSRRGRYGDPHADA
jgi:single-stranded DNA-binding protein